DLDIETLHAAGRAAREMAAARVRRTRASGGRALQLRAAWIDRQREHRQLARLHVVRQLETVSKQRLEHLMEPLGTRRRWRAVWQSVHAGFGFDVEDFVHQVARRVLEVE